MTDVYRCHSRACWSIREAGRVVGHASSLAFRDVDAKPQPRGGCLMTATCGKASTRDGRMLSRVVGGAPARGGTRLASAGFRTWSHGLTGGSFVITQSLKAPEELNLLGEFTAPKCPRQRMGQFSQNSDWRNETGAPFLPRPLQT